MADSHGDRKVERANSVSHASENSQTAQEYIETQLALEAEAREALPYQFDTCTRPLGPLRQLLFSCLTCNPAPATGDESYTPAGICYSCSISCHGEHDLVELFNKRNFLCDCGTSRIKSSPCTLRINAETGQKGNVQGEKPAESNKYNQNFRNKFCACETDYDAQKEKGTMFQCLGLGSVAEGGCGEDWYHPECIMGLGRDWREKRGEIDTGSEKPDDGNAAVNFNDDGAPPGFPNEDDFEYFICYKCVDAFPWIKKYASTNGFLRPVFHQSSSDGLKGIDIEINGKKRRAMDDDAEYVTGNESNIKRQRSSEPGSQIPNIDDKEMKPAVDTILEEKQASTCRYESLPPTPPGTFSLFMTDNFREFICRCPSCFPRLVQHTQLLEEEDNYEPPLSTSEDDAGNGGGSVGSRSLLERGEAALNNVDRVRAIEGLMVYNHLKDKVKDFLTPFAESGTPVGAEDIKKYFEKLRGDEEGIKAAASMSGSGGENDNRKEQSGY